MNKELTLLETTIYKVKIPEYLVGQEVYLLKEEQVTKIGKYLKALELIVKKLIDVEPVSYCKNYKEYNRYKPIHTLQIAPEEFDLIKEIVNEGNRTKKN